MKLRVPLFIKLMVPLVTLIGIVFGASVYWIYRETYLRSTEELNNRLRRAAVFVAENLDKEALLSIRSPEDIETQSYQSIRALMDQARHTANLAWMGAYKMENGYWYYWVDADDIGTGYPFFRPSEAHRQTYLDRQPRIVEYSDEFGAYYASIVPILGTMNGQEQVIGILEANVYIEERQLVQRSSLEQVAPFAILGTLLALVTSVLVTEIVFWRPLRKLKSGAAALSGGSLGYTINIDSHDELSDMAAAFNQMSARIQTLLHERIEMEHRAHEEEMIRLQEAEKTLAEKVAERTAELAAANQAAEHARSIAEAASKSKSEFLANMSHEIRTPMNAILGMTSLLLKTTLTQRQRDFAETIRSSGDTLLSIINDILDFSKIEAGKLELEEQAFDLHECIEPAMDLMATRASQKGIDLIYMIDPETPERIISDSTRLRQILLNLLSNAIKFTQQGEITLSVHATPQEETSQEKNGEQTLYELHFSVKDTGIGIPPDRMNRLFQSFSQVDASTTRKFGGSGLGLAICKLLTDMLKGKIWVESEVGVGSTFYFTLPVRSGDNTRSSYRWPEQPLLSGRRLLVVDDNHTNLKVLSLEVESWNMKATTIDSAPAALDLLKSGEKFDLAILDMQMPDMDGLMLADQIHHLESAKNLPLVMLTSMGSEIDDPRQKEFHAFLTKPVKPSQLFNTLLEVFTEEKGRASQAAAGQGSDGEILLSESLPFHILLVDDNSTNQKLALMQLEVLGFHADIAGNGYEALHALKRQPYNIIFMDVQMPEMDGLEATQRIRRDFPPEKQPWIIAMTANAMRGDREICLEAGMDDYLPKPILGDDIVAALRRVPEDVVIKALDQSQETGALHPSEAQKPGQPAAQADPEDTPVVDVTALDRLRNTLGKKADALIPGIIESFYKDNIRLIEQARQSCADGDAKVLMRAAHTLKSTSATFGANHMASLARELETRAREGQMEGSLERIDQIEAAFNQVWKFLEGWGK